jgi:hypothetical protein
LREPFGTRSLAKVCGIRPPARPDRATGHHPSSGPCSRNCDGGRENVSGPLRTGFISAISASWPAACPLASARLLNAMFTRRYSVDRGGRLCPGPAGPGSHSLTRMSCSFTDANVIFATSPGRPVVRAAAHSSTRPGLRRRCSRGSRPSGAPDGTTSPARQARSRGGGDRNGGPGRCREPAGRPAGAKEKVQGGWTGRTGPPGTQPHWPTRHISTLRFRRNTDKPAQPGLIPPFPSKEGY